MARIIVEQVFEGTTPDETQTRTLDDRLEAHGAAWRRSYASKDGRRMTCEFEGRTERDVRTAFEEANMPFVNIWEAELADVDDYPEQYDRLERVLAQGQAPASIH